MRRLLTGVGLFALMIAGAARAQTGAQTDPVTGTPAPVAVPPQSAVAVTEIGEVVVTANKRAQNVQDVPASVQAIGGDSLRTNGVAVFTDLAKVAPSLVIAPAEQPANSNISLRGIGTTAFSIGVEPSVAVQIDDVPIAIEARAFTGLNDIERIEVLNGPQSTLYGKSASAGLINIITPQPTRTLSGRMEASVTSDGEYDINGVVSGPITDTLSYRLSADYDHFDGNVRNVYNGNLFNGHDLTSVYGKLQWKPTSRFQATLGANYNPGSDTFAAPFIRLAPDANLVFQPSFPPSVFEPGVTAGLNNQSVSNNYESGNRFADLGQSLRVSYDLDFATLVSITSHEFYFLKDRLDADGTSVRQIDNRQDAGKITAEQYTQELRLVSRADQPLRYTAGLFYASNDDTRAFKRGPIFALANWYATSGSEQEAVFGQIDWDVLKDTTLSGGARYQHERVSYTYLDKRAGNAFFSGASPDDFFTYKFSANHKFTSDISAYVSYTTGHKGEAYDLTSGFNLNRALGGPVLPETSESYEAGVRSQFFERRLTLNLTYFNATYDNLQAQGIETLPDGTPNYRLANVGRVGIQGVELQTAGRVDNLNVGLNATWLDANIDSFPDSQCYPLQTAAQGCVGNPATQSVTGRTPPQAPKWKFALTSDYHHRLGQTPLEGFATGIYSYQTKVNYSLSQDPETIQGAFGILNLTFGVRNADQHWTLTGFVNNVTDQRYFINFFNQADVYSEKTATAAVLPRDIGRYAGVRVAYTF